jgi:hypothetical protein
MHQSWASARFRWLANRSADADIMSYWKAAVSEDIWREFLGFVVRGPSHHTVWPFCHAEWGILRLFDDE